MWAVFNEWCAELFGLTRRGRGASVLLALLLAIVAVVLGVERGLPGIAFVLVLLAVGAWAARDVTVARDALWRSACLPLDHAKQRPEPLGDVRSYAPTVVALRRLALVIDAVRRARYAEAAGALSVVDLSLLRDEELRLLNAARGIVAIGLGESARAAKHAVVALPTGSFDIDTSLGRTLVADAWSDAARLRAIETAWARAGVAPDIEAPLGRLRRLVRVRVDSREVDSLGADEARAVADEARAIGDDDMAAELDVKARSSAYR